MNKEASKRHAKRRHERRSGVNPMEEKFRFRFHSKTFRQYFRAVKRKPEGYE